MYILPAIISASEKYMLAKLVIRTGISDLTACICFSLGLKKKGVVISLCTSFFAPLVSGIEKLFREDKIA